MGSSRKAERSYNATTKDLLLLLVIPVLLL
jgi:hypothetical protein